MGILKQEELETMALPLDDETMNAIINEGEKVRLPDIPPGQTEANRKIRELHRQVNLLQDSIEILEHRKRHLSVYLRTLETVFNLHSQKNPHLATQAQAYGDATARFDSMPLLQNVFDDEIAILQEGDEHGSEDDDEDIAGSSLTPPAGGVAAVTNATATEEMMMSQSLRVQKKQKTDSPKRNE